MKAKPIVAMLPKNKITDLFYFQFIGKKSILIECYLEPVYELKSLVQKVREQGLRGHKNVSLLV